MDININETNDNNEEVVNLDPAKLNRLNEFKTSLEEKQTICKSDILSVEEFVGSVFTSVININKYSDAPSLNKYAETREIVNEVLENVEVGSNTITFDMLVCKSRDVMEYNDRLINSLQRYATSNIMEVLSVVSEEKYRIVSNYSDQDTVIDINELPLIEALKYDGYYNYFSTICEKFDSRLVRNDLSHDEVEVSQLLSLLYSLTDAKKRESFNIYALSEIELRVITVGDWLKILENSANIKAVFDKLKETLEWDRELLRTTNKWYTCSLKELTKEYNRYKNLEELLNEKTGMYILSM